MRLPVSKHCPRCGSDDITAVGVEMKWDVRAQSLVVTSHDGGWICDACSDEFDAPALRTIMPSRESIERVRNRIAQIETYIASARSMGRYHDAESYERHISLERAWLAAVEAALAATSLPLAAE